MNEPLGQQADIEAILRCRNIHGFLGASQQVKQQCGQTCVVEFPRDELIARAVPAAPAPMDKENEDGRAVRDA